MLLGSVSSAYFRAFARFQDVQHGTVARSPLSKELPSVEFNWDNVKPQSHLICHDCFDSMQCARLQVPMNWTNSSTEAENGKTVSIT
ncbi:hypothetical protein K431DRAFT_330594 [Polychaeton citri CBS 116435]|uniref:Uncharacterized protein n=1 Tax=Polychaeton citri CBS 116435 TaxID=1314669 RepID=A0A9P4Q5S9_9PEZI|nr:hypothetical protein K431DRAFT_330594 [Polychaeton citri CBS 116435]